MLRRLLPVIRPASLVAFLIAPPLLPAQESDSDVASKVEWLQKNAVRIRSIDPGDDDFSDLMPLKKIIGNARVVQLGEQSHGDGATF